MTNPACSSCKYWGAKSDIGYLDRVKILNIKTCTKIPHFYSATDYKNNEGIFIKPEYVNQLAFCQDATDYIAELLTRAEFFCAHYEEQGK